MNAANISGPASVTLSAGSLWGPFCARRVLRLRPVRIRIVNTGSEPVSIQEVRADPLRESEAGAGALGELEVAFAPTREEAIVLDPGGVVDLVIAGTVPARPRIYASSLRVRSGDGELWATALIIRVAASPAWGIACMLIGLFVVGVIHALDAETGVQNKVGAVLRSRQEMHEFLEKHPAPESQQQEEAAFDENLSAALAILHRRRSMSVKDGRLAAAEERMKAAQAAADLLRKAQEGTAVGQVEVGALEKDWDPFDKQMKGLGVPVTLSTAVAPPSMAAHLQAFLERFQKNYLLDPMQIISDELASQYAHARLAYASGQGELARTQALLVRRWMRRAAQEADGRTRLVSSVVVGARRMVLVDEWIRQRGTSEGLTRQERTRIVSILDKAVAALQVSSTLNDYKASSSLLEQAHTALVRAEGELMKERTREALKSAEAETNLDEVMQVINAVSSLPDRSPPAKIAGTSRIMEAWRTRFATVKDEGAKRELLAHVERAFEHLKRGDLEGVIPENQAIRSGWDAYVKRRLAEVTQGSVASLCDVWRLELRRKTDDTEKSMRILGPRSEHANWEQTLDQLRLAQLAIRTNECLDRVVELNAREGELDNEVFTASLGDAGIAPEDLLAIAEQSGVTQAIVLSRKLFSDPRSLTITTLTPVTDRYVGRDMVFSISNLDPVWHEGVLLRFDFGDGTPPLAVDAEQLRQHPQLSHRFDKAARRSLHIQAAETFDAGSATSRRILGDGYAVVTADLSPITQAQKLADEFLNLRFFIALVIASGIYYWRFHSKSQLFGARGLDYVEAFALGATVSAAASDLPTKLEKFLSP